MWQAGKPQQVGWDKDFKNSSCHGSPDSLGWDCYLNNPINRHLDAPCNNDPPVFIRRGGFIFVSVFLAIFSFVGGVILIVGLCIPHRIVYYVYVGFSVSLFGSHIKFFL